MLFLLAVAAAEPSGTYQVDVTASFPDGTPAAGLFAAGHVKKLVELDDDGRAVLELSGSDRVRIYGWTKARHGPEVNGPTSVHFDLPEPCSLDLTVVNRRGALLDGGLFLFVEHDEGYLEGTWPVEGGRAGLQVPCGVGSYAVHGGPELAGEHVPDVDFHGDLEREIVLVEGELLRGQATNWLGQPIERATGGEALSAHGVTDAQGFYAVRLNPDQDHHLRFMRAGRTSCATAPTVHLPAGEPFPETLDIQLPLPEPREGWWGRAWRSYAMPLLC